MDLPENQNDSLQFVRGFFLVSDDGVPRLVREWVTASKTPIPDVHIELPPEAKTKLLRSRDGSGMIVRWKGTLTAISVLDSEAFERCLAYFTEDQSWNLREEVTYGSASGKKLIRTGEAIQGHFKDITYLLSVPGGHIDVTTGCAGKQLDKLALLERLLEDAFRTATVS